MAASRCVGQVFDRALRPASSRAKPPRPRIRLPLPRLRGGPGRGLFRRQALAPQAPHPAALASTLPEAGEGYRVSPPPDRALARHRGSPPCQSSALPRLRPAKAPPRWIMRPETSIRSPIPCAAMPVAPASPGKSPIRKPPMTATPTATDNMRTAAEVLVDQLLVNGVRHAFCVPGESYLAVLDAFHDRDIAVTVVPAGGRRRHDGGGGRQGHRPAGHLLRHPRTGCNQCVARHPHRAPGFHPDDPVRRPDRPATCATARRSRSSTTAPCSAPWPNGRPRSTIPSRIPEIVSHAFHVAANGRPGPVVIALPEDMLTERIAVSDAPPYCEIA